MINCQPNYGWLKNFSICFRNIYLKKKSLLFILALPPLSSRKYSTLCDVTITIIYECCP